jgi:aryl-alcohol dehydrogenase-like predicted oxidoreductase
MNFADNRPSTRLQTSLQWSTIGHMHLATIERTDLRVSRVGFGTASMHHLLRTQQRQSLLEAALDAGITHFDTSPYYAYGLAESDLGYFIKHRRDAVTITSKVGMYSPGWTPLGGLGVWARKAAGRIASGCSAPRIDWTVARARKSLDQSLKRLRTDYLDVLLLHEPAPDRLQADDFLAWVQDEQHAGRIRHWGLAGESSKYRLWLEQDHAIAQVTQTHDSLNARQGDSVLDANRSLQFTYGYLAAARQAAAEPAMDDVMRQALDRNDTGCVLISTRRAHRITTLAAVAS